MGPFNWSPNSVFYRYLSIGRSNQKIQKTRSIYFLILLLAGLSPPSQLVPNPFNWSPKVFLTDILVSVAQIKKNKKQYPFIFKFCFLQDFLHPVNWSLTDSTGPKPIQLVPKQFFLQISRYRSLN